MTVSRHSLVDKMREEWNRLSRENAFHYIASLRDQWHEDDFLLSGESDVAELVDPILCEAAFETRDKRVLEVGCGVGRMTFALAKRFAAVEAVDISNEMIEQARKLQERIGVTNVRFQVGSGQDLKAYPNESVDFCFSYIVFQHIPDVSIVLNYIREMGRVLKRNGLFLFQVNGYRRLRFPRGYYLMWGISATHRLRKLNIKVRPHLWFGKLDGWHGVPISVSEVQEACASAGLTCEKVTGIGTQFMWVNGKKKSSPEAS